MELPIDVLIHNSLLGLKGAPAHLLQMSPDGFYEVNMRFGGNTHRVLLPVAETVVIARDPEEAESGLALEVER